jgi:hypothetical protein
MAFKSEQVLIFASVWGFFYSKKKGIISSLGLKVKISLFFLGQHNDYVQEKDYFS